MDVFIARQPIFNKTENVKAYELFYRDTTNKESANIENPSIATKQLLSNAITVFDIQKLSNNLRVFINFDCSLIIDDFLKSINPDYIIVKLPKKFYLSFENQNKLQEYCNLGYIFAANYEENKLFNEYLKFISYVLIDTSIIEQQETRAIVNKMKRQHKKILAYKIEIREAFDLYKSMDIDLYEGYFFEKPMLIYDKSVDVSRLNYFRMINELNKENLDFYNISNIIKLDTALTYQLFRKLNKVRYIQFHKTKDIMECLVRLGEDELRSWLLLITIRQFNKGKSDELAKHAYIRGVFMEKLMAKSTAYSIRKNSKNGYIVGMFSMLPLIADSPMEVILSDIDLPEEIDEALLGNNNDNVLKQMLDLVIYYENGLGYKPSLSCDLGIDDETIASLYTDCIFAGDVTFRT